MDFSSLFVFSLAVEVIGVGILGFGLAVTKDSEILAQASTYWNANPPAFKALILQRFEVRWGVSLLFCALVIQLISQIFPDYRLIDQRACFAWASFLFVLVVFFHLRRKIVRKEPADILDNYKKKLGLQGNENGGV